MSGWECKNVLVTGGTRGIGKAIADLFVSVGAEVTVTCTGITDVPHYSDRTVMAIDFTHLKSTEIFADHVRKHEYDICVNNAGINIINNLGGVESNEFDKVMQVNLYAPFKISQAASGGMVRKGWGRIVNIASIWSVITKAGRVSYTTSKAGLAGMTRTLAVELAKDNVIVNSVSPGFTMTDLTRDSLSPKEIAELEEKIPLGRLADPDEIANLVLFLCGEDNTYIVGQNIVADGGFTNV